jgi:spermidine synthase
LLILVQAMVYGAAGGNLSPQEVEELLQRGEGPRDRLALVAMGVIVAAVAEEWFGFTTRPEEGLRVDVGDGLERVLLKEKKEGGKVEEIEKWDAIVIDVDNAYASLGISCPAPAFLTPSFLEACRARLKDDGGVLIMNVAARSSELLGGAIGAVEKVFGGGEVHEARPTKQDVNRVLFALKTPRAASACKLSLGLQTEKWLEECFPGSKNVDPLGLCEMLITKRG